MHYQFGSKFPKDLTSCWHSFCMKTSPMLTNYARVSRSRLHGCLYSNLKCRPELVDENFDMPANNLNPIHLFHMPPNPISSSKTKSGNIKEINKRFKIGSKRIVRPTILQWTDTWPHYLCQWHIKTLVSAKITKTKNINVPVPVTIHQVIYPR
jgi:hypothetical protein